MDDKANDSLSLKEYLKSIIDRKIEDASIVLGFGSVKRYIDFRILSRETTKRNHKFFVGIRFSERSRARHVSSSNEKSQIEVIDIHLDAVVRNIKFSKI